MTGALLRTGSLDVFHPLGAEGNPVHTAAAQLRAAIARRLGPEVADTFAIPQRNEDGDTIDWYAPQSGQVIPWVSATEEERTRAKVRLVEIRDRVEELSVQMAADPDSQRQAFSRLLEHVTTFPDEEHVYLVDDHPVVTFWGFRHHNAPAYSGALLNPDALVAHPSSEPGDRRIPWWWWLLGALLFLAVLFFLLRACAEEPSGPGRPAEDAATAPAQESAQPIAGGQTDVQTEQHPETLPEDGPPTDPQKAREEPVTAPREAELRIRETAPRAILVEEGRIERDIRARDSTPPAVDAALAPADAASTHVEESLEDTRVRDQADDALTEEQSMEGAAAIEETEALYPADAGLDAGATPGDTDNVEEVTAPPPPDLQQEEPPSEAQPPAPEETSAESGAPEIDQEETAVAEETARSPGPEMGQEEPSPLPGLQHELQEPQASAEGESLPQEAGGSDVPPAGTPSTEERAEAPIGGSGTPAPQTLRIPPEAVTGGSVRFTDGGWRTSTSLQDGRGLPVEMRYQLNSGRGSVELKRHDGSICAANVQAAMRDGKLVIDSAADITCPDGTNFGRPRMECTPGQDGRADCAGHYPSGESFSVDMRKSPRDSP
jgi:hypothetical protein